MTRQVDPNIIETVVGAKRHPTDHLGRFVSFDQTMYILHSKECRDATEDLRTCPFSLALDQTPDASGWNADKPVLLFITETGELSHV